MEGELSLLDFYDYVTSLWIGRGSITRGSIIV
jgi:hypothetical protein